MAGSYAKAKGRSKGQFVMVRHDIMQSDAWLSLTPYARTVWLTIMKRYNGNNNGEIPLGVREASIEGAMSKGKAKKCFDELMHKGFIKIGLDSSFTCKYKRSRRWTLTHEKHNKQAPSNEWRKWRETKQKI